ncbi:response regulator [Halotia branconii]|uniref:Protein PatA n=1 Tax=Halotia branconii CENA392 TaxID=1539056 RepID=A0AAJ6NPS0_9CYAN|nr:response regulator [Halotia branconii]WGV24454.1 response regulator [Halotia branconii CENA392]
MKTLPISRYRFFQKLQPLSLLKKITGRSVTGCLQVFSTSGSWSIYVDEGKLIYACYSEKMFEPLYRNLQKLSQQISTLPRGIHEQLQAIFETGIENQAIPNPDYLAICWLVTQKYISPSQAAILIEQLALEVLESFLGLEEGSYEFIPESFLDDMPKFCHLNLRLLVEQCQKPSLHTENVYSSLELSQRSQLLRPTQPRTQPKPEAPASRTESSQRFLSQQNSAVDSGYQQTSATSINKKTYTIFCIDDSPAILNVIKNFLDEQIFTFIGVTDSLKALMEILRTKPDMILLNVDMPNLNGYELCSLLRKHSHFKNTPVIMVTGKIRLIDRARAKLVGASGYLKKPFTQGDLLKTVFQHIV